MRLTPLLREQMSAEQLALNESIQAGIKTYLKGFVSQRADGALIGPFNPMLHFPRFGKPVWDYTMSLSKNSTLPKKAHEVAILVTGARYKSRYEIYAHEYVAKEAGLSDSKIAAITAGQRPNDLSDEESVAYDVAALLSNGGQLPESAYQLALKTFGKDGLAELVYLIGAYCLVSVLLNAYDISVPGREEGLE